MIGSGEVWDEASISRDLRPEPGTGTIAGGETITGTATGLVASVSEASTVGVRGVFTDDTGTANDFTAELVGAVVGLLDGGTASGNAIANLLNRLFGLLG